MEPDKGTEVDVNEVLNDLGQQIAQLTVQNTLLRIENNKLRGQSTGTIVE